MNSFIKFFIQKIRKIGKILYVIPANAGISRKWMSFQRMLESISVASGLQSLTHANSPLGTEVPTVR